MPTNHYYEFGPFRLDVTEQVLLRDGRIVPLGTGEFLILRRLLEKRDHTVDKFELSRLIRGPEGGRPDDATVTRYVSRIKEKLGESLRSKDPAYIKTISRKGYRFIHEEVVTRGGMVIAILPFKNFGAERTETDLGLVFAELLSRSLINLKRFPVIPSSELAARESAGTENMRIVVSGSLMVSGRRVLVILYVRRNDGELSLRSPSYREKQVDVIHSLELIAEQAAAEVVRIVTNEQGGSSRGPDADQGKRIHTSNEAAHKLYEEGWSLLNRRTPDALIGALESFKRAVRKDPTFAEAYVGVADCNLLLGIFGSEVISPKKVMPRAKKAALRALEIDESLGEAHASLAAAMFLYDRDWQKSEIEFQKALHYNPEYATARQFYAHNLALLGRTNEALDQIRVAQSLRHSPIIDSTVSRIYFLGRRYDEAIEAANAAINRYRQFFLGYVHLGIVYKQLGNYAEAIEQLQKARELAGTPEWGNPAAVAELGHGLALAGRKTEALQIIEDLRAMSRRHYVGPFTFAKVYLGLGMLEETFDCLEQTFSDRSAWLLTFKQDPSFDPIREEPQFLDLLKRIGLP